ncbi:MAG: undecaprenyl-phosphate glucose phosphotransferase [Pelagibacterales bacterium]|nr:undecaprenyl-phosphate glucose phosphotransferase [Pelagibacterales bacterium]
MKGYSKYFWFIHFLGDIILINISFLLAYYYKFESFTLDDKYIFLHVIFNFIWISTAFMLNLYSIRRLKRIDRILFNLMKAGIVNGFVLAAILFSLNDDSPFSREHLYFTYFGVFVLVLLWRYLSIKLIFLYRKYGYNYDRVVIIGGGDVARGLHDYFFSNDILGLKLLGIFYENKLTFKSNVKSGSLNMIKDFIIEHKIDEIYYTMPLTHTNKIQDLVDFADQNLIRFKVVPDFRGFPLRRVNIDFFDNVPVLSFRKEPLKDNLSRLSKRFFDIFFSFSVIIFILSWLYPLIGFLIKVSSTGPILFKQKRSGLDNKEFWCYKFRSMRQNSSADLKQASKNDSRITVIGKFLRQTSLDEFPQFVNVFKGDMSVVGPRPHMVKHTEQYSALIKKYMVRQLVKPGITGSAQIRGFRGETKELNEMEGRVKWDVWYIENWTFFLDINIIFKTIFDIFKGDEKAY